MLDQRRALHRAARAPTSAQEPTIEALLDVDRAYRDHRRLVVTSNADLAELRDRLGARVGSRFVQAAMTAACGDVDLRRPVPTLRATGGGR